jgi:ATP-dependent Clp protease ATP-binding subunit ClpC
MRFDFTDRVRKVLAMASEEAIRLGHEHVGTEHLLLGLLREREGVAAAVPTSLSGAPSRSASGSSDRCDAAREGSR